MKKAFLLVLAVIMVMAVITPAGAVQSTILERRNEYGGRTEQETYSSEDAKYKEGLSRLVQYFDGNERIIKLESYYNQDHALMDGIQQSIQYFDNKLYRTGIRTRVEFVYTDSFAAREGLARAVQYYDEDEKRSKIEYFYTDAYARKRQVARLEVLYDPKGSIVTRTYFDKDRNVLVIEPNRPN